MVRFIYVDMSSSDAFVTFLRTVFTSRLDFGESVTFNTCFVFLPRGKTSSDLSPTLENTANLFGLGELGCSTPSRLVRVGKR